MQNNLHCANPLDTVEDWAFEVHGDWPPVMTRWVSIFYNKKLLAAKEYEVDNGVISERYYTGADHLTSRQGPFTPEEFYAAISPQPNEVLSSQ